MADDIHRSAPRAGFVFTGLFLVAFLLSIAGIVMAILLIGAASFEGAGTDAAVSRAVDLAATGPFLLASMGFVAFLAAVGLQTRRTGVYALCTAHVAMAGAVLLALTFLTVLSGEDSAFGIGFPLGFLCLLIWSVAVALAKVRPRNG